MMRKLYFFLLLLPFCAASQTTLPEPGKSHINFSRAIGWKGKMPKAPAGFTVSQFADGFESARWIYVMPNGDVLVADTNAKYPVWVQAGAAISGAAKANNMKRNPNKIILLRDSNKDGKYDVRETFLEEGLN
ncbi:MAG TPA: sorbosone dehydrogenase family protein, partial [Flavobacterium sp.]|nr:sorbosone dehydrogenase family protein [Flavobacterium sp.]